MIDRTLKVVKDLVLCVTTTQLLFKMFTLSYKLNLSSTLTDDIWVSQQVTLHLECTNFIATTFDDVNTAAAHDPIHTLFVDRCIT